MEWGIFSDDGQLDRGFASKSEAERTAADDYHADDAVWVAKVCPDHPSHADASCEECNAEVD